MDEGLVVRPGDVLIVRMDGPINASQASQIKDRIRESAPDLADVLIITAGDIAVYRPGGDDE